MIKIMCDVCEKEIKAPSNVYGAVLNTLFGAKDGKPMEVGYAVIELKTFDGKTRNEIHLCEKCYDKMVANNNKNRQWNKND